VYHSTLGARATTKKKKKHLTTPDCWRGEHLTARKVDIRLPGKGDSNSHGARPVC